MGTGAETAGREGPSSPEQIRNVVLVGPAGAGKTTLFERLVTARAPGRHQRGEPSPSQSLAVASVTIGDLTVKLLDSTG
jgi:elongation factor G